VDLWQPELLCPNRYGAVCHCGAPFDSHNDEPPRSNLHLAWMRGRLAQQSIEIVLPNSLIAPERRAHTPANPPATPPATSPSRLGTRPAHAPQGARPPGSRVRNLAYAWVPCGR